MEIRTIKLCIKKSPVALECFQGEFLPDFSIEWVLVPEDQLAKLKIERNTDCYRGRLPYGEDIQRDSGRCVISCGNSEVERKVLFGKPCDVPSVGVNVLLDLGFLVDPMTREIRNAPKLIQPICLGDMAGIKEQYQRAKWFLELSQETSDVTVFFRLLMASVNAARGIVEQACYHSQNGMNDKNSSKIEDYFRKKVRHCQLIADIRKNDFHRLAFNIEPAKEQQFMHGPVELQVAGGGTASLIDGPNGIEPQLSPGSSVSMSSKHDKHTPQPIQVFSANSSIFVRGGDLSKPLPLFQVLREYLYDFPIALDKGIKEKVLSQMIFSKNS